MRTRYLPTSQSGGAAAKAGSVKLALVRFATMYNLLASAGKPEPDIDIDPRTRAPRAYILRSKDPTKQDLGNKSTVMVEFAKWDERRH